MNGPSRTSLLGAALAVAMLATACAPRSPATDAPPSAGPPPTSAPPIELHFAPFDDAAEAALAVLDRAERSVRVAQYNIRDAAFHAKLVELRDRGVEVEIVVDAKNARKPWNTLDDRFEREGFRFHRHDNDASRYAIMHHKASVIDERWVMTGSFNWNATARLVNDEVLVVIDDPALAREYLKEIDELTGEREVAPGSEIAAGGPVEVFFAPEDRPDRTVIDLIDAAKHRIRIAVFTFRDEDVVAALAAAAKRGVAVEVVTERKQADQTDADETAAAAGVTVHIGRNDASSYSAMHHRYAVIDDEIVITGATNWTRTAFRHSNEDLLVIRDRGVARRFTDDFAGLRARSGGPGYDPADFDLAREAAGVSFQCLVAEGETGDEVRVVGDHPSLGDGDPAKGLVLKTDAEVSPRWTGAVRLPAGTRVEYRYVTVRADGTVAPEAGELRLLEVDPAGTDVVRREELRARE